jgi:CRISPR-associated protein Cmr2
VTPSLIAISVGPVQEFIAAARKTADLYAGSQLLMEVVGAAASEFSDTERIFPAHVGRGGANKILARVEGDPAQRAAQARQRAQKRLLTLWHQQSAPVQGHLDQERARAQLEHLLEFSAAWTPENGTYAQARDRVEKLLAGRKALRDFENFGQGDDGVPKSPLDPALATVFGGGQVPAALRDHWGFKASEVLDAVSLLKRLYGRGLPGVLNTHTLAHRARVPDAANSHEDDFTPASPYFAILVADGDSMGAILNGKTDPGEHRAFSRSLDSFAAEAETIVRRHGGFPVYAGGDDVLALLPVTTALACGQQLGQAFGQHVANATLSAGIAIVHYREPLSGSLKYARDAEKRAKAVDGKAAVCLALHTRGGVPLVVAQKWDEAGKIQAFLQADLPRGLPYELRELAREWPVGFAPQALRAEAQRIAERKVSQDGAKGSLSIPDLDDVGDLVKLSDQLILARFLSGTGDRA